MVNGIEINTFTLYIASFWKSSGKSVMLIGVLDLPASAKCLAEFYPKFARIIPVGFFFFGGGGVQCPHLVSYTPMMILLSHDMSHRIKSRISCYNSRHVITKFISFSTLPLEIRLFIIPFQ